MLVLDGSTSTTYAAASTASGGSVMTSWLRRRRVAIPTLALPWLLLGCSAIHLYDAGRESTAKNVKTKYAELELPAVIATEQQNLTALLDEELAVVREAHSLRLDLALLRIADDDEPIGVTLTGQTTVAGQAQPSSFTRRLTELGFNDVAGLRAFLNASDLLVARTEAVRTRDDITYALAGRRAPACGAPGFDTAKGEILGSVADTLQRGKLESNLDAYVRACGDLATAQRQLQAVQGDRAIGAAHRDWRREAQALAARRARAQELERSLEKASDEYEAAVAAERAAGTGENRARVETAAKALRDALEQAGQASAVVGAPALTGSRIRAIDTVLTALAGGRIDVEKVSEPDVRRAALVAGRVPALVGEIEGLVRRRRAPAVSPLVIEKQHQLLLRDDAVRRLDLAAQRIALLETKYEALVAEARYLVAERDGVCNVLQPPEPGSKKRIKCDTLQATVSDGSWTCRYELERAAEEPPPMPQECPALGMTWGKLLREGTSAQKRALWEAIAGLGGRLAIARPQQDEADFRLAHLTHLEVAAADEYAIRAWDALIATPVNQLAAYHQTGIKPAELADLIVKAIGLGAIGVGLNR
jgi:hypothetical protein